MQAEKIVCINCGAGSFVEARFCRQCGRPIQSEPRPTVTEGTTKLFEADPFADLNEWAGPMAKQGVGSTTSMAGKSTQALAQKKSHTNWLIIGLVAFAVISILTTALLFVLLKPPTVTTGPSGPSAPPNVGAQPPQPPQPPQIAPDTDFSQLIYPGADKTLDINSQKEGHVVQLQTQDSIKKVADWYTAKLKLINTVKMPTQVILEAKGITVIISGSGRGTTIMLTQEQDRN